MSASDPKNRPKPVLVTTTGVEVLVHGVDYTEPVEEPEVPPPDPIPTAIVFPPGQSIADRNAFIEGLEEQWGPFITGRLDRPDINAASAEELRQEALVILFLEYDKNKAPPKNVVAFLDKVLVNLICNHGRLARVKARAGDDAEAVPTLAPDPEQAVGRAELWHKMKGYVGRLSKEEAEVFEARELHGMIFEIIAAALERPFDTVVKQHVRALEKLRAMARASERPAALRASLPSSARGSRK
jgi:DNA-directed RNA polymerase specialized sigma24 family protein